MRHTTLVPIAIVLALLTRVTGCAGDLEISHSAGKTELHLKTLPRTSDQRSNATPAAGLDG